jgi:hypothetical protein
MPSSHRSHVMLFSGVRRWGLPNGASVGSAWAIGKAVPVPGGRARQDQKLYRHPIEGTAILRELRCPSISRPIVITDGIEIQLATNTSNTAR